MLPPSPPPIVDPGASSSATIALPPSSGMEVEHPPPTAEQRLELVRNIPNPNATEIEMQDLVMRSPPTSFRDKLLNAGCSSADSPVSFEEICAANPSPVFTTMEDPISGVKVRVPEIYIPSEIHEKLCHPWRTSVIVKLLGKSISFFTLKARLHRDWKTEKDFDIIDIGSGYYVVRFCNPEDHQKILTGGPYKIFDHYLAVQPWEPNFQPSNQTTQNGSLGTLPERPNGAIPGTNAQIPRQHLRQANQNRSQHPDCHPGTIRPSLY